MKGKSSIELNGKQVDLSFKLGVLEDFQTYLKDEGVEESIDEAINQMVHLRKLLELMSDYAGGKVEAKEFKHLDFSEIGKAVKIITDSTENIQVGNGKTRAKK